MIWFTNAFVKLTGWLAQLVCFKKKIHYINKHNQNRHIHGPAIIISNHTSVYDYALMIFVFWTRTLRYQMAECLFKNKVLKIFLKALGGIFVDRNSYDFSFVNKSLKILKNNGVVGIFPEARLPYSSETEINEFKSSATYIAIESLNSALRRLNSQRSVFPSDTALLKALYLATFEATKKWTMPLRNWGKVYGELSIMYDGRL